MASEVFFADFSCKMGQSQLDKMMKLVKKAGIDRMDLQDKYVAIKVHFGEWGNMAFLRQQYAKVICDYVKERGGRPFLTDCNTLYPGYRSNALDHLDAAYMNGYNPLATGVHTIIADGLRGTDERRIPVEGGVYVKEAKIGAAIAEADVMITLNHFKGHIEAGFGGAIKNIGMGSGSKEGKMEMHSSGTPAVDADACIGCGMCVKNCLHQGVSVVDGLAVINEDACVGCGHCFAYCPKGAINCKWDEASSALTMKIAEYAKATLAGKQAFHISFIKDVSPLCDCDGGNDTPIIPDVGMLASFDPVALDQACVDLVNQQPHLREERFTHVHEHADLFKGMHPHTDWEAGMAHAEALGIGTRAYELKTM